VINRFNLKDGRLRRPILNLQRFKLKQPQTEIVNDYDNYNDDDNYDDVKHPPVYLHSICLGSYVKSPRVTLSAIWRFLSGKKEIKTLYFENGEIKYKLVQ